MIRPAQLVRGHKVERPIDTSRSRLRYSDTAIAVPTSAAIPPASPDLALVSIIARPPRSKSPCANAVPTCSASSQTPEPAAQSSRLLNSDQTARPNPHSPWHRCRSTSRRDFVPRRFSVAGRISAWIASSCRRPKTFAPDPKAPKQRNFQLTSQRPRRGSLYLDTDSDRKSMTARTRAARTRSL